MPPKGTKYGFSYQLWTTERTKKLRTVPGPPFQFHNEVCPQQRATFKSIINESDNADDLDYKDLFDGVTTTTTGSLISVSVIIYKLNLRGIMKFAIPP